MANSRIEVTVKLELRAGWLERMVSILNRINRSRTDKELNKLLEELRIQKKAKPRGH